MKSEKRIQYRYSSIAWLFALCVGALVISYAGWLTPLDRGLNNAHMKLSPRDATGEIVFLAIDKKSLDEVGVWPWPRRLHAQLVEELNKAGARDIIFDVDFSARSNPIDDQLFAGALAQSQSAVALATFVQNLSVDQTGTRLGANKPIALFAEHAWSAAVNTFADNDAIVRSFFAAQIIDGEQVPSVPAYIAGVEPEELGADRFMIDFSIDARQVPTYSVTDLLSNKLDELKLKNKTVLIGAHALELRDDHAVPIYGVMAGPMLQILATETLLQNRVVKHGFGWVPVVLTWVLFSAFIMLGVPRRFFSQILSFVGVAITVELTALLLFGEFALLLSTAPLLAYLGALALVRSVYQLKNLRLIASKAEREKHNAQKMLAQIVTDSADAIVVLAKTGKIMQLNASARNIFQVPAHDTALDAKALFPPTLMEQVAELFNQFDGTQQAETLNTEVCLFSPAGPLILDTSITPSRLEIGKDKKNKKPTHMDIVCLTGRDVTQKRMHEIKLDHLSKHDELTGAMRRETFTNLLQSILDKTEGTRNGGALFCFDLHRFKIINDTMGREIGDQLLKSVHDRIRALDKSQSPVARLGSNTFGFWVSLDQQSADEIAALIAQKVRMPFQLSGHNAQVGVRISLAYFQDGQTADAWLSNAELALDEAKEAASGKGALCYLPDMSKRRERAREIEHEMWQALDERAFHVAYQPQVRFSDQRIIGAEALLRWQHARLGAISPAEFIPIAEANGMVETLGQFALEQACKDAAQWPEDIKIAVNVSPIQLMRDDLEQRVDEALQRSGLNSGRLQLEITETSFLSGSKALFETLQRLKDKGLSLALDDFGTGYSSYGYMAQLPLDKVKIDQMFVQGLLDDKNNRAMIQSMKTLAHEMGMSMICEGVETPAQMRLLMSMGCAEGQGYLFGKAMAQREFVNHLKHNIVLGEETEQLGVPKPVTLSVPQKRLG